MDIKGLNDSFQTAIGEMKSLIERQTEEIAAHGETSKETATAIKTSDGLILELQAEFKKAGDTAEATETRLAIAEAKLNRPDFGGGDAYKSVGQQYVESDIFADHAKSMSVNNRSFREAERKDITDGAGSAGALTNQMRRDVIFVDPNRPMRVRDLIESVPTTESAVEITRELVFDNQASPQAGQLVAKSQSDITFELVTQPVQTLAHYIVASRQILADAPRLRSFIDGRLSYGLDLEADAQLLYGSGGGQDWLGLFVDSDIPDIGEIASGTTEANLPGAMINHVRKALTQLQLNNYNMATGVILNPEDWEAIETAKGDDGHYIWAIVPTGAQMMMWRVPVVPTNAVTKDDFLLGDFRLGATLYDREQKSVRISESHGTVFVENGVVILAEERAAFGIELPNAFAKGQFTVAAP